MMMMIFERRRPKKNDMRDHSSSISDNDSSTTQLPRYPTICLRTQELRATGPVLQCPVNDGFSIDHEPLALPAAARNAQGDDARSHRMVY
jgi:hypothetical protein